MNKKGVGARNVLISVAVLLIFGMMSILGFYMMGVLLTAVGTSGVCDSGDCDFAIGRFRASVNILDPSMAFLLGILSVGIVVTSSRVAASKLSFIITFISAPLIGLISYAFNYIFVKFSETAILQATLLFFPITALICTNLHWVALLMILLGGVSFFGKKEQGQFQT